MSDRLTTGRLKWPRPAERRKRAEFANSRWATPSHKVRNAQDAHFRNVLNWLSGYDAAMRDANRILKQTCDCREVHEFNCPRMP